MMTYKIKQRMHYALNTEISLNNASASNAADNGKYNIS